MARSMEAPAIGIDLGTFACVGVWYHDRVEIIENDHGNRRTPSCVAFTPEEKLIGEAAKVHIDLNPTNTIFDMKHLIGRHFSDPAVQSYIKRCPFQVVCGTCDEPRVVVKYRGEEKRFLPEQLSAMILAKLKESAENFLKCSVQSAVITVPAYFNDSQRRATRDAGLLAGFQSVGIMDEPVAAVVAYGLDKMTNICEEKNFLVFDLGGRTFNVSVINIKNGVFKVKGTAVDNHLGGEEFDKHLLNHFLQEIKKKFGKDISDRPRAVRRLRYACERAKRKLSFSQTTTVEVPSLYDHIHFSSTISMVLFGELNKDLFIKCFRHVTRCLEDAHMNKTCIDKVVLVGGSTRVPLVQQKLQQFFPGKELCKSIEPEKVVAYGAALQAEKLRGHVTDKVCDLFNADVISPSSAIETQAHKLSSQKIMGQSRKYVHPKECAIGIDFGTVNSCVAVWQESGIKIIKNEYGSNLTGSDITLTETGKIIGASAEQVLTNPATTIFNIKRLIGRCSDQLVNSNKQFQPFSVVHCDKNRTMVSVHYNGKDNNFAPEEIVAMVLSKMKEIAEEHLNFKISNAVISVPACFSDSQRKAIGDASVIAGLNVMQLLNEPTAAAIAYFLQKFSDESSDEKTLLIFGLGGGFLEVTIVSVSASIIKVHAVVGDTNLGGEDFDYNMMSHFVKKFMKEKKRNISNKPRSLRRLTTACEKAKRILSQHTQTTIEIDALDDGIDFWTTVTRKSFEELNMSLFKRCMECVEKCLTDAKLDKSCIDEVVLVGGSTRIPIVQQLLQEFFSGKELCKGMDLDETVAYGAAARAAILSGNKYSEREQLCGLQIQDVTSCSLWLEGKGGVMNLLIPKNTPIPTKKELLLATCSDNQTSITVEVHERELEASTVFTLSGIQQKQRDGSIKVSFEVDHNGFLNLTTEDTNNVERNEIIISKENGGLTIEEIQKMVEEAARYKAEDEENKARAVALHSLENFVYELKAIPRDAGVSAKSKKLVEEAADDAIKWMETNYCAAITEISDWRKKLESIKSQIVYLGTSANTATHNERKC